MSRIKEFFSNMRTDTKSAVLSYTGSYVGDETNNATQAADNKWQIKREYILGTETITTYANDGSFDQVWDDRETIFPAVPFPNTISLNKDGVDEYIDFGDNYTFGPATAFSYSFWIKPQNVAAQRCLISKASQDANVYGYGFYHDNTGKIYIQVRAAGTLRAHTFSTVLSAAVWSNVVITYNGGSDMDGFKVYINGTLDASTPSTASLAAWVVTEPLKLGRRSTSFHFSGKMNNVSVWDKELTQTDVDDIYNGGTPGDLDNHGSKLSRLSWWKLNSDANFPTEVDQVGNIDGTLVNMEQSDYVVDAP